MSHSLKEGPLVDEHLLAKVDAQNEKGTEQIVKTWLRHSTTLPDFIGHAFAVHDGRKHVPVFVDDSMVGHKPGELAPTKTFKGRVKDDRKGRRQTMSNNITSARTATRSVRVTPMKARRVLDIIRGKSVDEALNILEYAPQGVTDPAVKVIASAAANAESNSGLDRRTLVVSEAYANEEPTMKRFRPHTQGHVFHVRKHASHITVVVEGQKEDDR